MPCYSKNTSKTETRESTPPNLIAYHVTEGRKEGDKGFWTQIGAAWEHQDGKGLTLQLDLVPVNAGRIVLRTPAADEQADTAAGGEGA